MSESKFNAKEYATKALDLMIKENCCTVAFIQRNFQLGYAKASYVMEVLEKEGYVILPECKTKGRYFNHYKIFSELAQLKQENKHLIMEQELLNQQINTLEGKLADCKKYNGLNFQRAEKAETENKQLKEGLREFEDWIKMSISHHSDPTDELICCAQSTFEDVEDKLKQLKLIKE